MSVHDNTQPIPATARTILDYHPVTPNGAYRKVSLPDAGYAPADLVEQVSAELERSARLKISGLHQLTACERLAAWLLSGNVPQP